MMIRLLSLSAVRGAFAHGRFSAPRVGRRGSVAVCLAATLFFPATLPFVATARAQVAPQQAPGLFAGLQWRMIGPFRGGRTVGGCGVPGQPSVFYIGVNNGGVWKTTDYGRTWDPIFDAQPTGSIGAVAVSPSDPDVVYVGSGEGLQRPDLSVGDGIYKSTDAGATWRHLGLRDGQQIPAVIVDPRDSRRVFAAVLGHPYGPNPERGIFRSIDGGETWKQVLSKDPDAGGVDVLFDPSDSRTVFAVLWAARQAPWEADDSWTLSAANGLYKSTDGGDTWRQITSGLPGGPEGLGRIGLAVSAQRPRRMYAVLGARQGGGLYRSDDRGESWKLVNADRRLWDRDGDFNEVKVDPIDPDVVYVANVVAWKSVDGGRSFTAWRGAPGGDDYHRLWINPLDPRIILLTSDQGAIVTVNGGRTWSSWYNQPTAQLFHVSTDGAFPYHVYGAQQESGSAGVASRGDDGQITFRDWHPVGAEEYGYILPDPLHPDTLFGGKISRYDRRTGQVLDVSPDAARSGRYRSVRTLPLAFSPADPRALYFGTNVLFRTLDGGNQWETVSPDLTRPSWDMPACVGAFAAQDAEKGAHRGVIYTVAPSPTRAGLLWVGTDDGLIHVTHDGGASWRNVTPPALSAWSKVSMLEASRFDTLEAFAAINRLRLDDLRPHVYRTRDGGRTWQEKVGGLPGQAVVNAVREDPVRRGLLFAAAEGGVYVSFDDGDRWQPLRLNLPVTSVRDLVVHEADVVIATHGRSFWILDDIAPLREAAAASAAKGAYLCEPPPAVRARWNKNTDTPLPFDEPAAKNPPDGAILDYYLPQAVSGPVTVEIVSADGGLVRRFSSEDPPDTLEANLNIPTGWIRPGQQVPAAAGAHRLVWDLRYPPPPVSRRTFPIAAVRGDTPREPRGPWALPGRYTVRLSAGGRTCTRELLVRMDPRVPVTRAALQEQFALCQEMVAALRRDSLATARVRALRARLKVRREAGGHAPADSGLVDSLEQEAARLEMGGGAGSARGGGAGPARGAVPSPESPARGAAPAPEGLARLAGQLSRIYQVVVGADVAPSATVVSAARRLEQTLVGQLAREQTLEDRARALEQRPE